MTPTENELEQETSQEPGWAGEMLAMIDRRIDERVQVEVKRQLDERIKSLMRNMGYRP